MADQTKNPKNNQSFLFRGLTKLFSGPIVNRRVQMYRQQRRRDLDKYKFKSAQGMKFQKSVYNPMDRFYSENMLNRNRAERYTDFDQMEYVPEIASAMDIYADEMTTSTVLQPMLDIKCKNEEIRTILHNLFHNVINVEFNLYGWCRSMCKYGDYFLYMEIDEDEGIKNVVGLPTQEVERLEGEDPTNPNYVQYQWNSGGITFENWQVAHFRVLGNDKHAPYGSSILEPARRIWRQLTLLEDAMMAYRIVRSPERRVFYIDIGNIAPQDVEQHMQRVITSMKRNQVVDSATGRVDLRYNPLSVEEDYFLPVRGGDTNTRIENLPGGTFTGDIDDVKYLRDKLFAALKVPQSYLSSGEGAEEEKTTLAQKDVRFARTIKRLQRSVISELEKMAVIHLYTLGFRGDDLVSFSLGLNNPSKIAELQELEHWRTKFEVASSATEGMFSQRWIASNLFGLTDEEAIRMQREMFYDKKLAAALAAAEDGNAEDAEGGELGGGGDLGGDDLGGDDLGGDDLGGDDLGGEEETDDTLLAAPDELEEEDIKVGDEYTKPGWKGKTRVKKGESGKKNAARQKSMKSKFAREKASSTSRNVFPGLTDLATLYTGLDNSIYEGKDTNYLMDDEKKLFSNKYQIKKLISGLEESKKMEFEDHDEE
tara:strand:- start:93443 stop:95398 length:1956 start_codon:yes stop_codon:yes gene_type:complete